MSGALRSERKPVIGLVGGIGAGKSRVAQILAECGAGVIDSDALSRALLAEPEVVATLRKWWGEAILDREGRIDRGRVGDMVFTNAVERARLEGLLHPRIAQERLARLARFQADPAVRAVVLDSPLLFETGLNRQCDTVWFVDADPEVRAQRVTAGRGWSRAELDRREKLQMPLDLKRGRADSNIVNNSDAAALRAQVVRLFHQVLDQATHVTDQIQD